MAARARSLVLIYGIALAVILLYAAFPMIAAFGSGAIANMAGCQFDEGSVHPCVIGGIDYGGTLYLFGVLGWFTLITVPFGAVALAAWLAALIIHTIIRLARKKP